MLCVIRALTPAKLYYLNRNGHGEADLPCAHPSVRLVFLLTCLCYVVVKNRFSGVWSRMRGGVRVKLDSFTTVLASDFYVRNTLHVHIKSGCLILVIERIGDSSVFGSFIFTGDHCTVLYRHIDLAVRVCGENGTALKISEICYFAICLKLRNVVFPDGISVCIGYLHRVYSGFLAA